jgi:hypothetical protein
MEVKKDSDALTAQQRRFPYYRPDGPEEAFGCPSVFEKVFEHLSKHKPQGTHVRTGVRTAN